MDEDVLRAAIRMAFDLPADCPKLSKLVEQLDLVTKASETGQDVDAAFCSFLERTMEPA